MNRNNKILVGVLAFVVAMTIGYAIFSDKITVIGTAKAKGDFSLITTCEKGLSQRINSNSFDIPSEGGYENDSCIVNDNEVSFHADLRYPGATRYFTIKITNTGTIDAYSNINTGMEAFKNRICIDGSNGGTLNGTIEDGECYDDPDFNSEIVPAKIEFVAFEKKDGTIFNGADNSETIIKDFFDETGENIILKPGESAYLLATTLIDKNYGSDNGGSFLITADLSGKLNFTQKIK